jgi:hypothetical protein
MNQKENNKAIQTMLLDGGNISTMRRLYDKFRYRDFMTPHVSPSHFKWLIKKEIIIWDEGQNPHAYRSAIYVKKRNTDRSTVGDNLEALSACG